MNIRFRSDFKKGTKCKYSIEHKDNTINALEMTPSKEHVAFASGNSLKFIYLHKISPNPFLPIDCHEGLVSKILFPQKQKYCIISAGEDCSVRINGIRLGKGVKLYRRNTLVYSFHKLIYFF